MTEPIRRGMLTIVAIALIALPKIAGASPILHVAPQWPGGALNGSEAARNARHEAHGNGQASDLPDSDVTGFDDLGLGVDMLDLSPLTVSSILPDLSTLPSILDPADLPNILGVEGAFASGLATPNISALTDGVNPSTPAVVSEPGSLLLLGSGVVGVVVRTRRRRHQ